MIGGDLMVISRELKNILSNKEVLNVNQNSQNNYQLSRNENKIIWIADVPGTQNKYVAFFNIGEEKSTIDLQLKDIGIETECQIRDLWQSADLGNFSLTFSQDIDPHSAGLFRINIEK